MKSWVPLIIFLVLGLLFWLGLGLNPRELPSARVGQQLPEFNLPLVEDPQKILASHTLKGQIILINVWASWCENCIEEQAFLMKLSKKIPIYGLNYKDDPRDAIAWLQQWGNPYIQVAQDRDGQVGIELGVYGAPETFLIDEKGMIQYRYPGALTEAVWTQYFLPRIKT